MSDSTNRSPRAKPQFYSDPEIAKAYDEQRFGGASGAWVNAREIEMVLELATPFRRALDLGCGTGRLMRALTPHGSVIGVDWSMPMLAQARRQIYPTKREVASLGKGSSGGITSIAQGDAFSLPFADASFDAVIALRLLFHFEDLETPLREVVRVLAPRGIIVFDTYVWSPRAWLSLDAARWGGGIFVHPPPKIEQTAERLGLQIAARRRAFLFSPYLYRLMPLAIVRALGRLETRLPARWRSRIFWKLVRQ